MHVAELSDKTQDYLKAVFDLQEWGSSSATLGRIAQRLGQRNSTASEAIKRLAAQGLVEHTPYSAIELTDLGRKLAIQMVRRHRLIETFLFEELGYSMEEVHDEAEHVEHAVSDKFVAKIEEKMGFPRRDPHGDPIPNAAGEIEIGGLISLAEASVGSRYVVDRLSDRDSDVLAYLQELGVVPGATVDVRARPIPDLVELTVVGAETSVQLPAGVMGAVKLSDPESRSPEAGESQLGAARG